MRATDSDALVSRIAAARAGYLPPDPYAQLLAPDASADARRPPLINIGTYLRAHEMDARVSQFVDAAAPASVQIVSLGAGSDTRFWRLVAVRRACQQRPHAARHTRRTLRGAGLLGKHATQGGTDPRARGAAQRAR